jgi:hypothetical protein
MALLRDFGIGRLALNPQNSPLFLRFKPDARLELTQKPSSVDARSLDHKNKNQADNHGVNCR